jgi:thiol-disulfide isomerase/thioredoxin
VRRALVLVLACLLLASCSAGAGTTGGSSGSGVAPTHVDVDTPALRSLKAAAKVEPCRPGTAASQLPKVTLACLGGGRAVDLAKLRGPLVINLFAQWCGPCRSEMPYYQALHEKGKGVVSVLGIDYLDPQPTGALDLAKQTGVTYPLLADPAGVLRPDFRIRGLPGVVFVGKDGTVSAPQFRVVRSYAELRTLVQQQLHVSLPA